MTPQQYEHLTELFHAALEIAPGKRAAYLDHVSNGDAELRRELESLLAAHEQRAAYTEKPPDDIAAGMYLAEQDNGAAGAASLAPNTRLDRYEIRSLLAKGGMGEVYLAEDMRLHRKVALKILPAAVAANQDRMRPFRRTPAGYGSYDLLTSVTGCSRQRVYLLLPIWSRLSVVSSQVCLKLFSTVQSYVRGRQIWDLFAETMSLVIIRRRT